MDRLSGWPHGIAQSLCGFPHNTCLVAVERIPEHPSFYSS